MKTMGVRENKMRENKKLTRKFHELITETRSTRDEFGILGNIWGGFAMLFLVIFILDDHGSHHTS